jgi:hypothetical protein
VSRLVRLRDAPVAAFIEVDPRKVGHTVHGTPVVPVPTSGTELAKHLTLVAVGAHGAREKIRRHLVGLGLVEGRHFVCVA